MALKHLVFLAILKLVSSAAVAEPDPDVIVQVKQIVNAEGCCPGDCCKDYCMLDLKKYRVGDVFEDACILLQCIEGGDWKALDFVSDECGKCSLYADPHIITYNPHTYDNTSTTADWIHQYSADNETIDFNEYSVSQKGISAKPLIGVKAKFGSCLTQPGVCVESITYYDLPDVEVELIVPRGIFEMQTPGPGAIGGCMINWYDASCETQINVKGVSPLIVEKPVPAGCDYCRNIYVVGLKGFTINLIVDPYALQPIDRYQVNILAENTLSHDLYGLCDRFIPEPIPQILYNQIYSYKKRDGIVITDISELPDFITSWKMN